MIFSRALSVELRSLIGPAPRSRALPVHLHCICISTALRLTEEAKSEARGISSSSVSVPDIGRPPGSPAVSTTCYWLLLRRHPRLEACRRSILPTNDLAASAHLISATPRPFLILHRGRPAHVRATPQSLTASSGTLPAVVITRRLPRWHLLAASSYSQALSFVSHWRRTTGTDLAVMLDPARCPFAG
ncbi:hypothetical protein HDV63DRAFT_255300 [Trichoderma sp. SZMC 28014]